MKEKIFPRNCPSCNALVYHTSQYEAKRSNEMKRKCKKCVCETFKIKFLGENNPFWGRHHTEENKKIASEIRSGIKQTGTQLEHSRRTIKIAKAAQQNKSCYQLWLEKYGKDEADRRSIELSKLKSTNATGEKNPMFGKPAPKGSGCGISCWYKENHFRSLKEVVYFIKEVELKNLQWRTAQTGDLRMGYVDSKGSSRTYVADFLVNENILIEVKPKRLWDHPDVVAKADAGRKFCQSKNWEYRLVDIEIDRDLLKNKILSGDLKIKDKYKERVNKYLRLYENAM